jgi:hypothetical protein
MSNKNAFRDNILHRLFDGKVYPAENVAVDSPKFKTRHSKYSDAKEALYKSLKGKDLEDFTKLDILEQRAVSVYGSECFAYGFKLAVRLLLESMREESGLEWLDDYSAEAEDEEEEDEED